MDETPANEEHLGQPAEPPETEAAGQPAADEKNTAGATPAEDAAAPAPAESAATEAPAAFDLSQLQNFSFGTQWTASPKRSSSADRRPSREDRPRRDDRRADRRPQFRQAAPRPDTRPDTRRETPRPSDRRPARDDRPPRDDRRPFREQPAAPLPPAYAVTFYPEDAAFATLAKVIRTSCRTYQLFDIASVVLEKPERFVAQLQRDPRDASGPFAISLPDGVPFENEAQAVAHILEKHLSRFFDITEVEIAPPKGNYQVVNRCMLTGALIAPPNYHLYNQLLQRHHAANVRMPLDAYTRSKVETVRDPELVAQWLEKMKKATRYTWKLPLPKAAAETPEAKDAATPDAQPAEGETAAPAEQPAAAPEAPSPEAPSFTSIEEARDYLLANARDQVIRTVAVLRVLGRNLASVPPGEIRRSIEVTLQLQRRFPLETANALRGRLRRENCTIFKKGSKGVSYVCAVKRKFRVPGQTFADSIQALMDFIEANPMIRAGLLPAQFLKITAPTRTQLQPNIAEAVRTEAAASADRQQPAASTAEQPAASTAETETAAAPAGQAAVTEPAADAGQPAAPETAPDNPPPQADTPLTPDEQARLVRMNADLRWLVSEGYVTEFIDGRLFAPPIKADQPKKTETSDGDEIDTENYPENPGDTAPKDAAETTPPAENSEGDAAAPVENAAEAVAEAAGAPEPETPAPAPAEEGNAEQAAP